MKIKIDLSKFRLKSRNDKVATLVHPTTGHEVRLAINALHPDNRKNLDMLKLFDGGDVTLPTPAPSTPPTLTPEQKKDAFVKSFKKATGYNTGGKVASDDDEIMADKKTTDDYNNLHEDETKDYSSRVQRRLTETDVTPRKYADGGDVDPADMQDPAPQVTPSTTPSQPPASPINPSQVVSAPPQSPSAPAGLPAASDAGLNAPTPQAGLAPATNPDPSAAYSPAGFQNQAQAIQKTGEAQTKLAEDSAAIAKGQLAGTTQLISDYQSHKQQLDDERKNIVDDINNSHIDPNRFLGSKDTVSRIGTAVGLILGGIGGGGHSNQALDFLNREIDRDIEAQKADLGKKHTLLSANLEQTRNLQDATNLTRIQQNDLTISKIQQAQANATSQTAKSNAQMMIGQLQAQNEPLVQQMAIKNTLKAQQAGGALSGIDPAQFVSMVVPPAQQKDVLHEISTAQNVKKNRDTLLQNFDQAAKDATISGKISHAGFTPPSVLSMRANMLPIIHDAEGRVNEFEQKTTSDLEPKLGDSSETIAKKRQAYIDFMDQKASAPTAKSNGIDLSKFGSTSNQAAPTQEQQYLQWARANPTNPKAQLVLKKLGQ